MICLDTNYLILGLVVGSPESAQLIAWFHAGERLITPMPAWYEFLCGPVTQPQIDAIRAFLHEIRPFDELTATTAAQLFNAAHRKRPLRVDAMIAATAITAGAVLATNNQKDFAVFISSGLQIV